MACRPNLTVRVRSSRKMNTPAEMIGPKKEFVREQSCPGTRRILPNVAGLARQGSDIPVSMTVITQPSFARRLELVNQPPQFRAFPSIFSADMTRKADFIDRQPGLPPRSPHRFGSSISPNNASLIVHRMNSAAIAVKETIASVRRVFFENWCGTTGRFSCSVSGQ